MNEKTVIGWREWLALPGLGVPAIKAKVDTGARTSALHAQDIVVFEAGGVKRVRFGLRPLTRGRGPLLTCIADVADARFVTDSGGHKELRYVIRADVALGGRTAEVELTLTDRQGMLFPMLLGRTALCGAWIVDPERSYTAGKKLARAYGRNNEVNK